MSIARSIDDRVATARAPSLTAAGRRLAASPLAAEAAAATLLAVILRVAVGPAFTGFDATWSVAWGEQVLQGQVPDFHVPAAPTPHPLANLVGIFAALLPGHASLGLLALLSWTAVIALAWGVMRLGTALFSRPVGLLAAALVVSRPTIGTLAAQSFVDLPFMALVVWAAALEVDDRDRTRGVAALLVLASLLRPEAWLIAAAYGAWLLRRDGWVRARILLLLAAGPILWAAADLLVTGDPFHSLHGTQSHAAELGRPRGLDTALTTAPRSILHALGGTVAYVTVVGAILSVALWRRKATMPLALAGIGVVTYLCLGVANLPLLERYLLLPTVLLTVLAAAGVLAWWSLPGATHRRRQAAAIVGALGGALLLAGVPHDVQALDAVRSAMDRERAVRADLDRALAAPAVNRAQMRCDRVRTAQLFRPQLLVRGGIPLRRSVEGPIARDLSVLTLFYAPGDGRPRAAAGERQLYAGEFFTVIAAGC